MARRQRAMKTWMFMLDFLKDKSSEIKKYKEHYGGMSLKGYWPNQYDKNS
jgi:hypothetical protein